MWWIKSLLVGWRRVTKQCTKEVKKGSFLTTAPPAAFMEVACCFEDLLVERSIFLKADLYFWVGMLSSNFHEYSLRKTDFKLSKKRGHYVANCIQLDLLGQPAHDEVNFTMQSLLSLMQILAHTYLKQEVAVKKEGHSSRAWNWGNWIGFPRSRSCSWRNVALAWDCFFVFFSNLDCELSAQLMRSSIKLACLAGCERLFLRSRTYLSQTGRRVFSRFMSLDKENLIEDKESGPGRMP